MPQAKSHPAWINTGLISICTLLLGICSFFIGDSWHDLKAITQQHSVEIAALRTDVAVIQAQMPSKIPPVTNHQVLQDTALIPKSPQISYFRK